MTTGQGTEYQSLMQHTMLYSAKEVREKLTILKNFSLTEQKKVTNLFICGEYTNISSGRKCKKYFRILTLTPKMYSAI